MIQRNLAELLTNCTGFTFPSACVLELSITALHSVEWWGRWWSSHWFKTYDWLGDSDICPEFEIYERMLKDEFQEN